MGHSVVCGVMQYTKLVLVSIRVHIKHSPIILYIQRLLECTSQNLLAENVIMLLVINVDAHYTKQINDKKSQHSLRHRNML